MKRKLVILAAVCAVLAACLFIVRWLWPKMVTEHDQHFNLAMLALTAVAALAAVPSLYEWISGLLRSDQPAILNATDQIPAPVVDFVGRDKEIKEIVRYLRGGGAPIACIHGIGGAGKSELARRVAASVRKQFSNAQLIVDMRGTDAAPIPAEDALARCVRAFVGQEDKLPDSPEERRAIYAKQLQGKRVIVLLDNVRDDAHARLLIPPPGCALLLTSRTQLSLPGIRCWKVDELTTTEAKELLREVAKRPIGPEALQRIVTLCSHRPRGWELPVYPCRCLARRICEKA